MEEPLHCRRDDFTLPPQLHYLNCAYMSPIPHEVQVAGVRGVFRKADPSRIGATDFFEDGERARVLFARLIGATDPQRIAIIPAASYGVATAARNTPVARGQNIVVAADQFPSAVYAWRELAQRAAAELRTIAAPNLSPGRARAWNERLLEAIDGQTAIVALPQVHWTDGTRFDLISLGQRARAVGAAFIIDGTQSIGALPFDVKEIQPDAVICAAYKWLLGPYSLGLAYFGPRYDEGEPLEHNWISRKGSEDFRGLVNYTDEYQPGALRYDVGERSNFTLLPMLLAGLELVLRYGPDRIQNYCQRLTRVALQRASELGYWVEDESARSAHLFGLRAPAEVNLGELERELKTRRVFVSLRGSALRVSPHVYNDERDIGELLAGLERVATSVAGAVARS
jgi:selenocysteine lyase/cysteine desulfurase